MSVNNFIPRVWSNYVITLLNKQHVFAAVSRRDFIGEIAGGGSSIVFPQIGRLSATAYSGSAITPQELQDAATIMQIDRNYESNFQLDDVDAALANTNLLPLGMAEGVYAIKQEVDAYFAGLYAGTGLLANAAWLDASPLDVDSTNIIEAVLSAGESLDVANVPRTARRFMIVPPWFAHKLALVGIINLSLNEQANLWQNGFIGNSPILGFNFYMSNNVSMGDTTTKAQTRIMYGVEGQSFAYAEKVMKTEAVRRELYFKDLVKMLIVYGAKIIRPDMTGTLYCDYTAEA